MSFVHLHVHSHYSLLDGFGSPKDIVKRAVEHGSPAIALTDHGNMYGALEFYSAAKDAGIKPIIGCEVYVAPEGRFEKTQGGAAVRHHLTLLARNLDGYRNLLTLVTKANLEGFYYKPRVDYGLLKAHSAGLFALSGCLAGEIPSAIVVNDEVAVKTALNRYKDIFGEYFYLEIQHHPKLEDQALVNAGLIRLSEETGTPLVASCDSHYPRSEDAKAQEILLCIQTGKTLKDEDRMRFDGDFSLHSPEDMREFFKDTPEAIENTLKIAEMCDLEIPMGQDLMPRYKTPNGESAGEYLEQLCRDGLKVKYGDSPSQEALDRLGYELGVVNNMGFNDYFLIVWDFVKFAKDNGITVGPGRGSAAGSLITYCLDVTELDPLRYGLIFERFLNPARISMPDVDIDFADNRRDEVLNYVREKYGRENVAQIITFGTMAARAAVRDVGRSMAYPYADVDKIAKLVPPPLLGKHVPLEKSLKDDPELRKLYETDADAKALLDNAKKLEGTVRHAGTHACAVVMSENSLVENTPLQRATGGGEEVVTQYSMKYCEDVGLLKMDFLGLKNLTIIQNALEIIKSTRGEEIVMATIPIDDSLTFELLQKGDTTGIFQLESAGMRRYIRELKPTLFEDIIAMISLYRPGPMEWIPQYIKGKHEPDSVRYFHSSFEPILKETMGVAIYQEQIMQIAREFAGFSMGDADILRKAVGKKNPALLMEQKKLFAEGAVKNGHEKKFADEVFEKVIEPFAGYGFNKSHAACYAMISYRTAYLKAHYPTEFMAALMSSDAENTDKVVQEISECAEMGISVLPPSINQSFANFTVVGDAAIRFGLSAIKGLGLGTIETVLEARSEGVFESLEDFLRRVPAKQLNKKTIEALAYSGALDEWGERRALAESFDAMASFAKAAQDNENSDQGSLFGEMSDKDLGSSGFSLKKCAPLSHMEGLVLEKQYLGLYVSSHPLKGLKKYLSRKCRMLSTVTKADLGNKLKFGGLLSKIKRVFTKSGQYMMYGEMEDPTGRIEVVAFPYVYNQYSNALTEDKVVMIEGKPEFRGGRMQLFISSAKGVSLETMIANAKESGVYDSDEKIEAKPLIAGPVGGEGSGGGDDGGLGGGADSKAVLDASISAPPIKGDPIKKAKDDLAKQKDALSNQEWKENPFIIELPLSFNPDKLQNIKNLLLSSPGERKVEIHIESSIGPKKRIVVPFGISLTDELKKNIEALV